MGILDALANLPATVMGATLGHHVTYRTYTASRYDPPTGSSTRTPTDASVLGMAEDYPALLTSAGASSEGGVMRGDKKVTIPASELTRIGVTPSTSDQVSVAGVWYKVVSLDADPSPIQPLTWVLQVRR